jgi:DNA-binding GntR family transcriptional regulator
MTRAELIRAELADQILAGRRMPGTHLDEHALAAEFGASRTPVREAIRLLAASGLVAYRPRRGAEVVSPSREEVLGMFAVLGDLEALAAGYASIAMSHSERVALRGIHTGMAELVRDGNVDGYAAANDVFHGAIYSGTHNRYLEELTRTTRLRLKPFRHRQFRSVGRLAGSHAEHGLIVESIARGDREAAAAAMRAHICDVRDAALGMIENAAVTSMAGGRRAL